MSRTCGLFLFCETIKNSGASFLGAPEFRQGCAVLLCFRQLGQSPAEQLDQFPDKRGRRFVQPVIHPDSDPSAFDPARMAQIGKVPGDRGLGQLEYGHQVADTELAVQEQGQDSQTGLLGQGLE